MVEVVYVEILDRGGRVVQRVRADRLPITIGRAYNNDVILDDGFVSPEHARIERDAEGHLIAVDLQSLNGLFEATRPGRVRVLRLHDDTRLRIGRTELRVRPADYVVAAPQPYAADGAGFASPSAAALAIGLGVAYFLGLAYLNAFQHVALVRQMAQLVPLAVFILLWALGWSVAGRVVAQRFHFLEHCAIAILAGVCISLVDQATDYYAFAFAAEPSARVIAIAAAFFVLTALLYAHSRVCSAEVSRRLLLRTAGIALLIIGLGALARYSDREEITRVPSLLKPPGFRVARARSVDEFLEQTKGLQTKVDELARKPAAGT